MNMLPIILQIISGAAGGNLAGALFTNLNLGTIGNSLGGIVGGALGGRIFHNLWASAAGTSDMQILMTSLIGGTVGGAVLTIIAGLVRSAFSRRT